MSEKEGVMLNMSLAVDLFINPYAKTKQVYSNYSENWKKTRIREGSIIYYI